MKIDNAQALTAQSFPLVGKEVLSQADTQIKATNQSSTMDQTSQRGDQAQASLSSQLFAQANQLFKASDSELQFQLDQDAGKMVLYLKDAKTGETIRQFPDKEALRISKQINDYLQELKSQQYPKDVAGRLSGLITDTKV